MTRTYQRLPSPGQVEAEMARIRKLAKRVEELATNVGKAFGEAEDAGHTPSSGDGIPPGRNRFQVSDPTYHVAMSGMHSFIRGKVRSAADKLRKVEEALQEVERPLAEAWGAYDAEHRENLARIKELEETARTYRSNGQGRY